MLRRLKEGGTREKRQSEHCLQRDIHSKAMSRLGQWLKSCVLYMSSMGWMRSKSDQAGVESSLMLAAAMTASRLGRAPFYERVITENSFIFKLLSAHSCSPSCLYSRSKCLERLSLVLVACYIYGSHIQSFKPSPAAGRVPIYP